MPAASAVSTMPVPLGTCTSCSSIVTRTRSVTPAPRVRREQDRAGRTVRRAGRARSRGRTGSRRSRCARNSSRNFVTQLATIIASESPSTQRHLPMIRSHTVEREVEVALRRGAVLDRAQHLHEPARPDAARRALAARLVHVELSDPQGELHHARPVVEDADDARADEVPLLAERVRVEPRVEVVGRHHREGRAAHHHGLQRPAVRDAAAHVLDEVRVVMPCGSSYAPGRATLPERQKTRVPVESGGRRSARTPPGRSRAPSGWS